MDKQLTEPSAGSQMIEYTEEVVSKFIENQNKIIHDELKHSKLGINLARLAPILEKELEKMSVAALRAVKNNMGMDMEKRDKSQKAAAKATDNSGAGGGGGGSSRSERKVVAAPPLAPLGGAVSAQSTTPTSSAAIGGGGPAGGSAARQPHALINGSSARGPGGDAGSTAGERGGERMGQPQRGEKPSTSDEREVREGRGKPPKFKFAVMLLSVLRLCTCVFVACL